MKNQNSNNSQGERQWGSRFGYLMVAAGAAIGLGNIWRFPYLAYEGGGGVFLIVYIIVVILMGHPMVEMETAIGRHSGKDTVTAFEVINKKWRFTGWLAVACTTLLCMYYVVVGGWVAKYTFNYLVSGDFGTNKQAYFEAHISSTVEPIVWTMLILVLVCVVLYFGITKYVEKIAKVMMPFLLVLLIICGIWALFVNEHALEGVKYYLLPDFSKLNFTTFAQAATQVLFSVGIGWGLYETLGANIPKENNLKSDAIMVSVFDTAAAILAGFVVVPTAVSSGIGLQSSGPALVFNVMTDIFDKLPGGRFIGFCFFMAILFAVISSLFSFFEITIRTFEDHSKMGRGKATALTGIIIGIGNIIVSLGYGVLSDVKLPWYDANGFASYGFYDWLDMLTAYIMMPIGCILVCIFIAKVWGFKNYEKEVTNDGKFGRVTMFDKIRTIVLVPFFMIVILLTVFGFIK